jgi:hypothetical protein
MLAATKMSPLPPKAAALVYWKTSVPLLSVAMMVDASDPLMVRSSGSSTQRPP